MDDQITEEEVERELEDEEREMREYFKSLIPHPFVDSQTEYPITMALIISEGRKYIGGISGIQEDMTVVMYAPMLVNEGMVQDPQTGQVVNQIALMPMSFITPDMDKILIRPSVVYNLRSKKDSDQEATTMYGKKWSEFQAAQAGIVSPNAQNLRDARNVTNVSKLDFGNGPRS